MSNELYKKLDSVIKKLDKVDIIIKEQEAEIKNLRRILKEIYKDNHQKKQIIDKYKEKCKL